MGLTCLLFGKGRLVADARWFEEEEEEVAADRSPGAYVGAKCERVAA